MTTENQRRAQRRYNVGPERYGRRKPAVRRITLAAVGEGTLTFIPAEPLDQYEADVARELMAQHARSPMPWILFPAGKFAMVDPA